MYYIRLNYNLKIIFLADRAHWNVQALQPPVRNNARQLKYAPNQT